MRIGIFGGSFNPVHNGHLRLAQEALSELGLDKVVFVPSFKTPLKSEESLLPAALRLRLLKRALKGFPGFSISLCEMKRKGVSFTVDTLRFFKKKFGGGTALYFLCGADTLKNFSKWKSPEQVLKLCHLVVMTRPGSKPKKLPAGSFFIPFDALPIASTEIRKRLVNKKNIHSLVPAGTEAILTQYYKHRRGGSHQQAQ